MFVCQRAVTVDASSRRLWRRPTWLVVAGLLALSGCADPYARACAEGGLLGAGIGGAIAAIAGRGKPADIALGAAGGAGVGTIGGCLVAENNRKQAVSEQWLRGQIVNARQNEQWARQQAAYSQRYANQARSNLLMLDAQYKRGLLTEASYHQQTANYRNRAKDMEYQIRIMNDRARTLRADSAKANGEDGGKLSSSAQQIEQARADQQRALEQLRSALSEMPAG